ncbi:hypothetical protein HMI54_013823 [Coelomomyces lativittatus]|nr:hypothetical protein HMI54_013823 [Coelomomyces lativittatus]KAJ1512798.1 hypothetical protein HMI56_003523 [Coelomomyces lativittatus]
MPRRTHLLVKKRMYWTRLQEHHLEFLLPLYEPHWSVMEFCHGPNGRIDQSLAPFKASQYRSKARQLKEKEKKKGKGKENEALSLSINHN